MTKIPKPYLNSEELLTMKEASKLLKVSEISVKRYVSKGVIPSVKIGGARRIIQNEAWESFVEYNEAKNEEIPEVTNGIQFYWSQKKPEIAQHIYRKIVKRDRLFLTLFWVLVLRFMVCAALTTNLLALILTSCPTELQNSISKKSTRTLLKILRAK